MSFGRAEVYRDGSDFGNSGRPRRRNFVRFVIFLLVFGVCAVGSLAYVFVRAPIFESVASVLITPPEGETVRPVRTGSSVAEAGIATADSGIVGVERYQLLATPLLTNLLDSLQAEDTGSGTPENLAELRTVVGVRQFETTNIVTLRATGAEPEILPVIVNNWLDLYRESQAQSQQDSASDKNVQLGSQVEALQNRIVVKRAEIADFQRLHDIVSMERDENRLLARLKGLTTSYNTAKEEELNAQSALNAIQAARRNGQLAIDPKDQRTLSGYEGRRLALDEQIRDIEQRFTKEYIDLDPNIKAIYRQRALAEERIAELRQKASREVLGVAQQRLSSASQSVTGLSQEFEQSKRQISEFSTRFAEQEALVSELAEMEAAHRQASDRLLRREVDADRGVTKVEVVESAVLPTKPIWPNYTRDAGIGVGGSLALAFLAVLIFDFFNRPARAPASDLGIDLMRSALAQTAVPLMTLQGNMGAAQIEGNGTPAALPYQSAPRGLDAAEIGGLVAASDGETRLVVSLLLSGIALDDIAALTGGNIDVAGGVVTTPSQPFRAVKIPDGLCQGFKQHLGADIGSDDPVWRDHGGNPRGREDLEALIMMAARDAGLAEPELATAEGILHSYLVYLVQQGMRLADLETVAGPMPPSVRAGYAAYSPAAAAVSIDRVETVHPAVREAFSA